MTSVAIASPCEESLVDHSLIRQGDRFSGFERLDTPRVFSHREQVRKWVNDIDVFQDANPKGFSGEPSYFVMLKKGEIRWSFDWKTPDFPSQTDFEMAFRFSFAQLLSSQFPMTKDISRTSQELSRYLMLVIAHSKSMQKNADKLEVFLRTEHGPVVCDGHAHETPSFTYATAEIGRNTVVSPRGTAEALPMSELIEPIGGGTICFDSAFHGTPEVLAERLWLAVFIKRK